MSEHKHTPGPWHTEELDDSVWVSGIDRHENVICDLVARDADAGIGDEDWANAHLLASAPDLLVALEALLVQLTVDDLDGRMGRLVHTAEEAIKRAKGEA